MSPQAGKKQAGTSSLDDEAFAQALARWESGSGSHRRAEYVMMHVNAARLKENISTMMGVSEIRRRIAALKRKKKKSS